MHRRQMLGALAAAGALVAPRLAQAAWPADRPIQVLVPGPAGGGMDILARTILPFVQQRLPRATFVVVNRPSAGGQQAFEGIAQAAVAQLFHHAGEQREVGAAQQRQADRIDILLESGLGDLLGGLVQARVDHLETVVSEGSGNGLGATVVAIQTWFRHDDAICALHKWVTLRPKRVSAQFRVGRLPGQAD